MTHLEAFVQTFEAMDVSETLLVMGGTWPNVGESGELHIGLKYFIPVHSFLHGLDKHPMRENSLWTPESDDPIKVDFAREKERLAHEPDSELAISYGKRFGRIGSKVVDIWTLGEFSNRVFHVGRSE